jgi:TMEM175 potassium channel family protein
MSGKSSEVDEDLKSRVEHDESLKTRVELEGRDKSRLESFVDGVFAVAITLLGLGFVVPVLTHSNAVILNFLESFWPKFVGYFLAFYLIGMLLNNHNRQFRNLEYADQTLWWLNIVFLAFIVLIPFATSIWTGYGDTTVGVLFFNFIMLISGLILYFNWSYAKNHKYLLRKDITSRTISIITYTNLAVPIATIIAIGLAFIAPRLSNLAYLLIIIIILIIPRLIKKRA